MREPTDAPIFSAPADLRCSDGPLVGWFTQPPGVVYQLTEPSRMTLAMATWAAGPAFKAMLEHFPASQRFYFVIDIRAMSERDAGVREVFMQLARESGSRLRASVIIPPRRASRLYLGALQAASALLSPFGAQLEMIRDVDSVLERYPLQHAA